MTLQPNYKLIDNQRQRIRRFEARTGRRPRVLLVPLDPVVSNTVLQGPAVVFADLGIDVDISPGTQTAPSIARMAVDHDVHLVVLIGAEQGTQNRAGAVHKQLVAAHAADIQVMVADVRENDFLASKVLDMIENLR